MIFFFISVSLRKRGSSLIPSSKLSLFEEEQKMKSWEGMLLIFRLQNNVWSRYLLFWRRRLARSFHRRNLRQCLAWTNLSSLRIVASFYLTCNLESFHDSALALPSRLVLGIHFTRRVDRRQSNLWKNLNARGNWYSNFSPCCREWYNLPCKLCP